MGSVRQIACCDGCRCARIFAGVFALVLLAVVAFAFRMPLAYAEDSAESSAFEKPDFASMSLDELKSAVETITVERDRVNARKADIDARIAEISTRLESVKGKLPAVQSRADEAVVERYKLQRHGSEFIDTLLSVSSFSQFATGIDYAERITKVNLEELETLRHEETGLELMMGALGLEQDAVASRLEQVSAALEEAIAARDEAQRLADLVANAHLVEDGADWNAGEEAFVQAWTPRIDAYLAGSPLEGQGATFAKAAWSNHIDPRFSPAISHIESNKGRFCIRPHNAWGWGAADSNPYGLASEWATWEDAINAHVSGLARGYGYTISVEGAQTYCPPGWETWYATTVAQMNSI